MGVCLHDGLMVVSRSRVQNAHSSSGGHVIKTHQRKIHTFEGVRIESLVPMESDSFVVSISSPISLDVFSVVGVQYQRCLENCCFLLVKGFVK